MSLADTIAALRRRIALLEEQIKWAISMDYNVPDLDHSDLDRLRTLAESMEKAQEGFAVYNENGTLIDCCRDVEYPPYIDGVRVLIIPWSDK